MQSYNFRSILTPVLITAGAAFLFMVAGCGRQADTPKPTTPTQNASASTSASKPAQPAKQQEKDPELYKAEQEDSPKLQLDFSETIKVNWVEKGSIRMRAEAKEGHYDGTHRMGSLKNFTATLYENGKPTTIMTAPRVLCDSVERTVTADGGVVLTSLADKSTVKSQWMKWFSREQRVVGNGGVIADLAQPDAGKWNMTGPGFVADTALKDVRVRRLVKGQDF